MKAGTQEASAAALSELVETWPSQAVHGAMDTGRGTLSHTAELNG